MELSGVGRYFNSCHPNNLRPTLSSCNLNVKQVATGALTFLATTLFLSLEKTLGVPGKAVIAGLIVGSGIGICYLLRSSSEEEQSDEEFTEDTYFRSHHISSDDDVSNHHTEDLDETLPEIPQLKEPIAKQSVDPRFIQLNREEEKALSHLRTAYCSSISIGIRSESEALQLRRQLEQLYANITKDEMMLLIQTKDFWNRLTDPVYLKTITNFLTVENFEILAEYCIHNNRDEVSHIHDLNRLIGYLQLETEGLDVESKLLAITNYENKLIAIAKSGHPGIDEKTFNSKILRTLPRKDKIFEIWKSNLKRVTESWDTTGILSRTSSGRPGERTNSISSMNPGNWPTEKIENFIKEVIEKNDSLEFSQIETMDEASLKILIRKISLQTTLEKYWALEAQAAEAMTVDKPRLERLLTILKTLADNKIENSAKIEAFWLTLSNTVTDYIFTPEKKAWPVNAIRNFKVTLTDKIKSL